jgi:hypothetical protein
MATLKFGAKAPAAKTTTIVEDKPKSQLWVNVGYSIEVEGESVFVSIPMGIPLDSIKELPTNTRNSEYNLLNQARNQLLADITAASEDLESGESHVLELEVQLRRIDKEPDPLPSGSTNPFLRKPA